jgi:hypothetical protein
MIRVVFYQEEGSIVLCGGEYCTMRRGVFYHEEGSIAL